MMNFDFHFVRKMVLQMAKVKDTGYRMIIENHGGR